MITVVVTWLHIWQNSMNCTPKISVNFLYAKVNFKKREKAPAYLRICKFFLSTANFMESLQSRLSFQLPIYESLIIWFIPYSCTNKWNSSSRGGHHSDAFLSLFESLTSLSLSLGRCALLDYAFPIFLASPPVILAGSSPSYAWNVVPPLFSFSF